MSSGTPEASSTMNMQFGLWNPWNLSWVSVEYPNAVLLLSISSDAAVVFPPMSWELLACISRICFHRSCLTCRLVGAVVMTVASLWHMSHHMVASAAVYVFPEALHDLTAVRSWFLMASSISRCLVHGFAPSFSMAKLAGSASHLALRFWVSLFSCLFMLVLIMFLVCVFVDKYVWLFCTGGYSQSQGGRVLFTLCSQCQALGQALVLCRQGRGVYGWCRLVHPRL